MSRARRTGIRPPQERDAPEREAEELFSLEGATVVVVALLVLFVATAPSAQARRMKNRIEAAIAVNVQSAKDKITTEVWSRDFAPTIQKV